MPFGDPSKLQRTHVFTIRPFAGRNSDVDALSIQNNEASGGSNFRTVVGQLRRRGHFSRIGITLTVPGGTAFAAHAIIQAGTGRPIYVVGSRAVFNIWSPLTSRASSGANVLTSSYDAGTVSLESGSRTVTGTGTAWMERGVHSGASMTVGTQAFTVRSVNSNTSMEMTTAASSGGTTLSYKVALYGSGNNLRTYPGIIDSYATPSSDLVGQGTARSVSGGTYVYAGGLFRNLGASTQLTAGSLSQVFNANNSNVPYWNFINGGSVAEIDGRTTSNARRLYHAMNVNGDTVIFNERWRDASGTNATYPSMVQTSGYARMEANGQNHFLASCERTGAGTVSVTTGSVTVTGTGTSFVTDNLTVGDDLVVSDADLVANITVCRISSVASNTSLTLSVPYDAATASGKTYRMRQWRRIRSYSGGGITLQGGTLIGAVSNGSSTVTVFPYFYSNSVGAGTRMQAVTGTIPNPYELNALTANQTYNEHLFISTTDIRNTFNGGSVHGILWNPPHPIYTLNPDRPTDGFIPVSMIAPKAKHIEWWGGRLFAADLLDYIGGTTTRRNSNGYAWTRVDEPFSWWNQYPTDGSGAGYFYEGQGEIRAMKITPSENAMALYKDHGILVLLPTGDSINPYRTNYIDIGPGPVSKSAILSHQSAAVYLTLDGTFRLFNGWNNAIFPCPLTEYIEANMNWAYSDWVVGVKDLANNELLWFLPTGSDRFLTQAIVYSYKYNQWYIYDFSSTPLAAVTYVDKADNVQERRFLAVDSSNNLLAFRTAYAYDFDQSLGGGTAIPTQWLSKELNLPIPNMESESRVKEVKHVELQYDPAYGGVMTVDVSGDGGATWTAFGTVSLTAGTAGTSTTLSGGTAGYGVKAETHMVRLTQTPNNTSDAFDMAVKSVRIYYTDMGEAHR